jgi:hypothetical protein
MTFYYCLKGTRAWGYFGALITLLKDLSVSEHPGLTVKVYNLCRV